MRRSFLRTTAAQARQARLTRARANGPARRQAQREPFRDASQLSQERLAMHRMIAKSRWNAEDALADAMEAVQKLERG